MANEIGTLLYHGIVIGTEQDYVKATKRLSQSDTDNANFLLGEIYYKVNYGVTRDLVNAQKYYQFVADSGDEMAKEMVEKIDREINSTEVADNKPAPQTTQPQQTQLYLLNNEPNNNPKAILNICLSIEIIGD